MLGNGGRTDAAYVAVLRDGHTRIADSVVLVAVLDGGVVGTVRLDTVTLALPRTRLANIGRADETRREVRMLAGRAAPAVEAGADAGA